MGCRYACICSGRCYEAEKYCGEAEDIYDELYRKSKEEEEYYKAIEDSYYKIWSRWKLTKAKELLTRFVMANGREEAGLVEEAEQFLKETNK